MEALAFLIHATSSLILYIVVGHVILSWLISSHILNVNNQFVYQLYTSLDKILEPLLRPIRAILPNMGGIDLSPIILLIGVQFIEILLLKTILPILFF